MKTFLSCSGHHHHSVHWHVSGVICLASHHFRGVPALSSLTLGWVMLSLFEHANQVWLLSELQTTVCAVAVGESWWPQGQLSGIDPAELPSCVATLSSWSAVLWLFYFAMWPLLTTHHKKILPRTIVGQCFLIFTALWKFYCENRTAAFP